jgi:aminoglycoside phosphotransferase (APT) family kinase protein
MRCREPITPESLCAVFNRVTAWQLAPRDVVLAYREWRWVAQLPGQRVAFVAGTAQARQRLARERQLLQLLADRVRFRVPRLEWVDPSGTWDIRRKVPGEPGLTLTEATHHQLILEDPAIAQRAGQRIGEILAEWHRAFTPEEARQLAPMEPPLAIPLERMRANLAIGIDDDALKAQVERIFARVDALEIGEGEVVLVHGDLGSHNVAFEPETFEVLGVYDFDAIACVDRHWDFKYVHSYPTPFRQAVLGAYQGCTGIAPDVPRITLYHALTALSYLAWRVDDPEAHDRLSGRDQAGAYRWVRQAVARALA